MNGIDDVLLNLVRKSAQEEAEGDFWRDGLLHCGKCGTAKQCRIELDGAPLVVGCMCRCQDRELSVPLLPRSGRDVSGSAQNM